MRISVLGQSNSILKSGFFGKLIERHQPIVSSSGRIGASPSLLGPYFAQHDFFLNSEFCIIDMCVIDFSLVSAGAIQLYDVIRWVEWIGHAAKRANCEPVFVCIPTSITQQSKPLISACISVFERNEWFYLDVRDVIANMTAGSDVRWEDLYRDGSHPNERLSEQIADDLWDFLSYIRGLERVPFTRTFPFTKFERVPLQCHTGLTPVKYSSSLIAFEGVRLQRGDVYSIHVGSISAVSGLMLNSAACKTVLAIEGDRKFNKNLRLTPYHPAPFEARIIPICKPIRDERGLLRFSVADLDAPESDVTFHSAKGRDGDQGFLELGDIVVERGYDLLSYVSTRPTSIEAIRWCPKTRQP